MCVTIITHLGVVFNQFSKHDIVLYINFLSYTDRGFAHTLFVTLIRTFINWLALWFLLLEIWWMVVYIFFIHRTKIRTSAVFWVEYDVYSVIIAYYQVNVNIDSTQVNIMIYTWSIIANVLLCRTYPFNLLNKQNLTVFWEVFKTLNNSKFSAFMYMHDCIPHELAIWLQN